MTSFYSDARPEFSRFAASGNVAQPGQIRRIAQDGVLKIHWVLVEVSDASGRSPTVKAIRISDFYPLAGPVNVNMVAARRNASLVPMRRYARPKVRLTTRSPDPPNAVESIPHNPISRQSPVRFGRGNLDRAVSRRNVAKVIHPRINATEILITDDPLLIASFKNGQLLRAIRAVPDGVHAVRRHCQPHSFCIAYHRIVDAELHPG